MIVSVTHRCRYDFTDLITLRCQAPTCNKEHPLLTIATSRARLLRDLLREDLLTGDALREATANRRVGPYRKDWVPRQTPAPVCARHFPTRDRCTDCYPYCGYHLMGCLFTTSIQAHDRDLARAQADFDYWLIAEGCPQYHGE